jgi:predicted GIY-YIG superfamily endonuclease
MSDKKWVFYIIHNNGATYAGVSPDPVRRLRQHNGEIVGGAKYTTSKGPGWEHICLVRGFQDKIHSMQFEWAVKHVAPRNAGGVVNRIKKLYAVLNKPKWTSKAPDANTVPLILEWKQPVLCEDRTTPDYVVDLHFLNNPPENP